MPFSPHFFNDHPELLFLKHLAQKENFRIFLVGGFLRDHLLKRQTRDFDFAVSSGAIALARRFAVKIKGAFVLLDQEAGCARVAKKTSEGLWTYDFADFRAKTIAGDLKGRDFTVNTLTLDVVKINPLKPLKEQIQGDSRRCGDLKKKIIRLAAIKAFKDDPLRMLRAYSLRAQLGFKIEQKTRTAIKEQKTLIRHTSPERRREELFKILLSPRAARVLKEMNRDGVLFELIPQMRVMDDVLQGGFHHLDVWRHSLETLVKLDEVLKDFSSDADITAYLDEEVGGGHQRLALLRLACLLHDIGKPDTKKKEPGGRISFHTHEHAGRRIARIIARQFILSTKERFALEDMVMYHLRPGYLSNVKRPTDKAVYRYFRDTKDNALAVIFLSMADQRATRGPLTTDHDLKHHDKICRNLITAYMEQQKKVPPVRLIGGDDLIHELGLKPGPLFSKILAKVEEAQGLGKIHSPQEALAFVRKIL